MAESHESDFELPNPQEEETEDIDSKAGDKTLEDLNDEDFDINYIINRNVQISYIMVEGHDEDGDSKDVLEDPFRGELPSCLPHTLQSKQSQQPSMPTAHLLAQINEEDEDKATIEDEGHCNEVLTQEEDLKHAIQTFMHICKCA